jgi:hypothetical protein
MTVLTSATNTERVFSCSYTPVNTEEKVCSFSSVFTGIHPVYILQSGAKKCVTKKSLWETENLLPHSSEG